MTEKTIKLETGYEPKPGDYKAIEERVQTLEVFARAVAVMLHKNGEGERLVGELIIGMYTKK